MTLKRHDWPLTIDTSSADLVEDFFVPALSCSVKYDRGVGYFSSGWLRENARGMVSFAANGGIARWVTSPILSERDWEALQSGDAARNNPVLLEALAKNIEDLGQSLETDTLAALAWMVADNILQFKLALPFRKLAGGDFHDKFGIFTDNDGNQLSFNGSYNESVQGTRNYESLKIFRGWEPAYSTLVESDVNRFQKLWVNQDPNVLVFDLPDAARKQIIRLRSTERPYPEPDWSTLSTLNEGRNTYTVPRPRIPSSITLRDYQEEAIKAWFDADCQGLLEMATGTGKTITALAAASRLYDLSRHLAVVISVPYQHLVDQWRGEAGEFGFHQPILAYQSKSKWLDDFNNLVIEFNGEYRQFIAVITTHTTFISAEFQTTLSRIQGPCLLIADEAHHLGAERSRENFPDHIRYRLALSATPDRWFDDIGTQALRNYFGDTVFAFPLEQAIGVSLTPYYYYPHLVALTDDEMEKYEALSLKIAKVMAKDDEESQEVLRMLLIKRARLLNTAENKLSVLEELLRSEGHVRHALFYCAPGQIDEVLSRLGADFGLLVRRFTAEESNRERQEILRDFADGVLDGLVAMKCLDEGVDVPSTRIAYFLASSSNPREFVQRRGRILRKYPGKRHSIIHDLIAVPPSHVSVRSASFSAERSIIKRELRRFEEFSAPALNKHEALDVIWDMASHYGLMDF